MKTKKIRRWLLAALSVLLVAVLMCLGWNYDAISHRLAPLWEMARSKITPAVIFPLLMKCGLFSFLTGLVTRWLQNRKDRFLDGRVDYRLQKDYVLVVGYDFQVKPLIKKLLDSDENLTALLMTDRDVRSIRLEMSTELTKEEEKRVLFMRRDLSRSEAYAKLRIRGAKAIYMMGDEGVPCRDGIILQASKVIADKVRAEVKSENITMDGAASKHSDAQFPPLKVYLQFDDPGFYSQMCSERLPMDPAAIEIKDEGGKVKEEAIDPKTVLFDLEVFNYYDSWVWRCWSEKDSSDDDAKYLPLRFKPDAERVELFVIGSGRAAKAVAYAAVTLMNYGNDSRKCRLTVISDNALEILPSDEVIAGLPELEVADLPMRELNRSGAARMLAALSAERTAVTIAIVEDAPERSVKTYMGLPFELRSSNDVSVLMWMGAQSRSLPDKGVIVGSGGSTPQVRYFGMSDRLPWYGSGRQAAGIEVCYYYSIQGRLPAGVDPNLTSAAIRMWDADAALSVWNKSWRWGKCSSINSAGSYKEKAAIIGQHDLTPELQLRLLKAEHNRWWAERLLANWRVGARDNVRRRHPNLVPFEELDEPTKDIDKINIAAMARQGFVKAP